MLLIIIVFVNMIMPVWLIGSIFCAKATEILYLL